MKYRGIGLSLLHSRAFAAIRGSTLSVFSLSLRFFRGDGPGVLLVSRDVFGGRSVAPSGLGCVWHGYPGLAPWATFCRRFAAESRRVRSAEGLDVGEEVFQLVGGEGLVEAL